MLTIIESPCKQNNRRLLFRNHPWNTNYLINCLYFKRLLPTLKYMRQADVGLKLLTAVNLVLFKLIYKQGIKYIVTRHQAYITKCKCCPWCDKRLFPFNKNNYYWTKFVPQGCYDQLFESQQVQKEINNVSVEVNLPKVVLGACQTQFCTIRAKGHAWSCFCDVCNYQNKPDS